MPVSSLNFCIDGATNVSLRPEYTVREPGTSSEPPQAVNDMTVTNRAKVAKTKVGDLVDSRIIF